MAQVSPRETGDMRMAGFAKRSRVFGVDEVFDVDGAVQCEGDAMAGDAGGHHAIEHVHAPTDHFQDLRGGAEPHGVARLVSGEERHGVLNGAEHLMLWLADGDSADRIAIESEFNQFLGGTLAQVCVD